MSYTPLPPHLDPRGRHRGASGSRSGVTWARGVGLSIGALLSVVLLVLSGYLWYTFREFEKHVRRLNVAVGHPPAEAGGKDIDGSDQNILLVGNDDRTNLTDAEVKKLKVGRDAGSMATDTMMIVHVPADGSKATLVSLPRDSYVNIPGHGMNKLNAAYVEGYNNGKGTRNQRRTAGADLLIQTVENLTGLTINHYVQVSLIGFYDISNAIGGVDVDLCHNVNDTVAYNKSIGSDGGSGLVLSKGKHSIKGVQALEFVRQRHNLPNGDLDRVRRQQYFLAAAFRKVASVGIVFKVQSLGDAVQRDFYLDKSFDIIDLAKQLQSLSANNITGKTIPFEGFNNNSPVGSVEVIDPAKVKAFVQKVINPPPKSTSTKHKKPKKHKAIDSKCIN